MDKCTGVGKADENTLAVDGRVLKTGQVWSIITRYTQPTPNPIQIHIFYTFIFRIPLLPVLALPRYKNTPATPVDKKDQ